MAQGRPNKLEDVFKNAVRDPKTGCLIWQGAYGGSSKNRYGVFRYKGRNLGTHIASWMVFNGSVPAGHEVGHRIECKGGGLCIEPSHLIVQTHTENMAQRFGSMEFCGNGLHPWVPENIYIRKDNGRRMCKLCVKAAAHRHQAVGRIEAMFIEQAIADAKEAVAVPEGEYDLRILSAETALSKAAADRGQTSDNMIHCTIAIESDEFPNAAPLHHYIMLVTDPEDKWNNLHLVGQKRFLTVFGIPYEGNGFDIDDFANASGRCLVAVDQTNRGEDVNVLRLPRLKEEAAEQPQRSQNARGAAKPMRRR